MYEYLDRRSFFFACIWIAFICNAYCIYIPICIYTSVGCNCKRSWFSFCYIWTCWFAMSYFWNLILTIIYRYSQFVLLMGANFVGILPQEFGGVKVSYWLWRVSWSTAQTMASPSSCGMQGGVEILFFEIVFSGDHLNDHEDCPFLLHGTPKITLLLCAGVGQAYIGASCLETVTRETRLRTHATLSIYLKVQLYCWFTMLLQPWSFFRSCIHQPWTAVHFLVLLLLKRI